MYQVDLLSNKKFSGCLDIASPGICSFWICCLKSACPLTLVLVSGPFLVHYLKL